MKFLERISTAVEGIETLVINQPNIFNASAVEDGDQMSLLSLQQMPALSSISEQFPNRLFQFDTFSPALVKEVLHQFDEQDLQELHQLYSQFVAQHITKPYAMVGTTDFKSCTEFLFFETFKISLEPQKLLPTLSIRNNTPNDADRPFYYLNINRHAELLLNSIVCREFSPVAKYSAFKVNYSAYYPILNLLHNAFVQKYLGRCALNGLVPALLHYLDQEQQRPRNPRMNYWRQKALASLVIVLRQCTALPVRKMLAGLHEYTVANFLFSAELINQPENRACVETWLRGNQNIARYMLFPDTKNFLEISNLSYFSQKNLTQQLGLLDAKSYKVVHKLKSRIFSRYFGGSDTNAALSLYCIAHSRHVSPNSYCLSVLLNPLGLLFDELSPLTQPVHTVEEKAKNKLFLQKLGIAFDLCYEIVLEIWQLRKRNCHDFYVDVHRSARLTELLDFLASAERVGNLDTSPIDQLTARFKNLSTLNPTSTLQSVFRRVEQWHQQVQLRKVGVLAQYQIPVAAIDFQGYRFTPIQNNLALYEEGTRMTHCVFDFDPLVRGGRYLVFKVESLSKETQQPDEVERATLGLRLIRLDKESVAIGFHQCFLSHNRAISSNLQSLMSPFVHHLHDLHYDDLLHYQQNLIKQSTGETSE